MNLGASAQPPGADWTAEQVLAWMDSFRALILGAGIAEGEGEQGSAYDRIRSEDPSRRVDLSPVTGTRASNQP